MSLLFVLRMQTVLYIQNVLILKCAYKQTYRVQPSPCRLRRAAPFITPGYAAGGGEAGSAAAAAGT